MHQSNLSFGLLGLGAGALFLLACSSVDSSGSTADELQTTAGDCAYDSDCAAGNYCKVDPSGSTVCAWRQGFGARCARDGECESGYICAAVARTPQPAYELGVDAGSSEEGYDAGSYDDAPPEGGFGDDDCFELPCPTTPAGDAGGLLEPNPGLGTGVCLPTLDAGAGASATSAVDASATGIDAGSN